MENYGFIRVAACSPRVKVADVAYNTAEILSAITDAENRKVSLLVFPELCVTGYTCGDLFSQDLLIAEAEKAIATIRTHTRAKEVTVVVGVPVRHLDRLYNCAAIIRNGMLRGLVPKVYVPNYGEFYESRWFSSGADFLSPGNVSTGNFHDDGKDYYREGTPCTMKYAGFRTTISPNQIFSIGEATFAVEICEDLWMPVPPSSFHALGGARIIVNPSASNEVLLKHAYRKALVANQSARTISGYIYCSASYGESTQDMVFAGSSMICENGSFLAESERFSTKTQMILADLDMEKLSILRQRETTFSAIIPDGRTSSDMRRRYGIVDLGKAASTSFDGELLRNIEPHPFVPGGDPSEIDRRAKEITSIQVLGLMSRLEHIGCKTAVIGISGGLDSTLALLEEHGLSDRCDVLLKSHSDMDQLFQEESVDCITFNFGWLPKGDHNISTNKDTSIAAIEKGLRLLKNGGIMTLIIYYGRETGFEEKDAILGCLPTIDPQLYTVVEMPFVNRPNCPPIPIVIFKGK